MSRLSVFKNWECCFGNLLEPDSVGTWITLWGLECHMAIVLVANVTEWVVAVDETLKPVVEDGYCCYDSLYGRVLKQFFNWIAIQFFVVAEMKLKHTNPAMKIINKRKQKQSVQLRLLGAFGLVTRNMLPCVCCVGHFQKIGYKRDEKGYNKDLRPFPCPLWSLRTDSLNHFLKDELYKTGCCTTLNWGINIQNNNKCQFKRISNF